MLGGKGLNAWCPRQSDLPPLAITGCGLAPTDLDAASSSPLPSTFQLQHNSPGPTLRVGKPLTRNLVLTASLALSVASHLARVILGS